MTPPRADIPSPSGSSGPAATASTRVGDVAPADLLRAYRGLPRGFWEREGRWSAWAGAAAVLALDRGHPDPLGAVRSWAEDAAPPAEPADTDGAGPGPPRVFGGCSFDLRGSGGAPGATPRTVGRGAWAGFPAVAFHLPSVELRGSGGDAWLRATVARRGNAGAPRAAAERALDRARRRLARVRREAEGDRRRGGTRSPGAPEEALERGAGTALGGGGSEADREAWRRTVRAALAAIRRGRLEKVVPARTLDMTLGRAPDPVDILARLRALNPGCFPFLVEPAPGAAFAGAAPEIVAARRDGRFRATAVAGTVPDSEDPAERAELARRLLESAKDREEHEIGVRDMRRALADVAGVAEVDREPRVLRLRGLQHLLTNVSADVPDDLHVLELLGAVHPTAAVNGAPREEALAFLRRRERFDRGWYAGPVGWFDARGDGEFAPALRCALLRGREARLFAGAGIVEGSEPDDEWDETSLKLGPALEALGLDPDAVAAREPAAPGEARGLRP